MVVFYINIVIDIVTRVKINEMNVELMLAVIN